MDVYETSEELTACEQLYWQGAGFYAPVHVSQPWEHVEWHSCSNADAREKGLGTPEYFLWPPNEFHLAKRL